MRLCELEAKEVINACDCKKLGYVVDLIIDECQGRIEAIVIPQSGYPVQGRNLFTFSAGGTDFAYSPDGYTWKSGYRYTYNISIQEDGSVTITPPQSGLPGWGDESSEEVIQ